MDALTANAITDAANRSDKYLANRVPPVNGPFSHHAPIAWQAAYAMLSHNTSTSFWGYVFFNEDLGPIHRDGATGLNGNEGYNSSPSATSTFYSENINSQVFGGTTNSPPSSSGGKLINGTNSGGEFGFAGGELWHNAQHITLPGRIEGGYDAIKNLNAYGITSSHKNKRVKYVLKDGMFRAVDRMLGVVDINVKDTVTKDLSAIIGTGHIGAMDYNAYLKTLVCFKKVSYDSGSSSAVFDLHIWEGIDFDKNQSPTAAFNDSLTTHRVKTVTIPAYVVDDAESYNNAHPVITNDGTIYVAIKYTHTAFKLYKVALAGTTTLTATMTQSWALTTCYSLTTDLQYGAKSFESRDGTTVALYTNYYYYHCGIRLVVINREGVSSNNDAYTSYSADDTGYGYQVLPYKDNGWMVYYCGNGYGGNYNGSSIYKLYKPDSGNKWKQVNTSSIYLPYFTGPNTTNYPGMTHVADYHLLKPTHVNVLTGK